jgi:hypothetical protein
MRRSNVSVSPALLLLPPPKRKPEPQSSTSHLQCLSLRRRRSGLVSELCSRF